MHTNNNDPRTFPDTSDSGNGYGETKWDTEERLRREEEEERDSEDEEIILDFSGNDEGDFIEQDY